MTYRVHLENFEGPLDLLLYFIRRDEINIYDIPISHITEEFMETLDEIKKLNINFAGDFVVMASTLMRIKSKMLLPRPELDEDDEIIDPRKELVDQLLNYSRFKEAAESLDIFASERSQVFTAGKKVNVSDAPEEVNVILRDVTLYDIARAFKSAMDNMPVIQIYELEREPIHLDEQKELVMRSFDGDGRLRFSTLINQLETKIAIVVTFLALLELIRSHQITIVQNELFGELEIQLLTAEA
ncbi:MAG TPA: segregation/condensation protein A [Candidatus Marinimicrobia bacterium]|jgi:segregation and condensation protein A|nr:segregation/condensation protein A [Candidatus Neomarinimicrobiota bacterium]MDP6229452.1 segregation/condensation protein A [Candidatus Neomarinimicrobiota bacterium]MDP7095335.1 segregation/condensation protein A [Candidatus Neomarinimicrobiota bacterium]MDP7512677.1 segregation/condensation protein A [Candidatus Neomarinimicrobiota bacterium]HBR87340.1 segregation/condensation protein A [Candidatus Neomarinimicrobiota bacterium]|tara:strand:+ start:1498 stop:2223 length:726 start_codon:yes stop_codon:yes gene_type:complete